MKTLLAKRHWYHISYLFKIRKMKVLLFHAKKVCRGSRRKTPLILKLGIKLRLVGAFKSLAALHPERRPTPTEYYLGSKAVVNVLEKTKNLLLLARFEPRPTATMPPCLRVSTKNFIFIINDWYSNKWRTHGRPSSRPQTCKKSIISRLEIRVALQYSKKSVKYSELKFSVMSCLVGR